VSADTSCQRTFFGRHPEAATLITSLLPTLLVSGLAILVPLILLLIAKKAHTLVALSDLHDRILTRYYKWLVLNVLIFFCVGVATITGFFTKRATALSIIDIIQSSFPAAGPFYVGWRTCCTLRCRIQAYNLCSHLHHRHAWRLRDLSA
jgi:hypothetical protein